MSAGDMSLLTKEIEIQLSKATRVGIWKNSDNLKTNPIQLSKRLVVMTRILSKQIPVYSCKIKVKFGWEWNNWEQRT